MYEYYLVNKTLNESINALFKKKYVQKQLRKAFLKHGVLKFDSHHRGRRDATKIVLTKYLIGRKFVSSEKGWNLLSEIKPNAMKEYLVITIDNQAARPNYQFILRPPKIAKWDGERFEVEQNETVLLYMQVPTLDTEEFLAEDCIDYQGE